jgi:thioredoxin family protein
VLQRLLGVERESATVEALGVEAQADWANLRTPETYLGHQRGERFRSTSPATVDRRRRYEFPERLPRDHWGLSGEWTIGPESVVLDRAGGAIAHHFHARDVHLVLSPGTHGPIPFRVQVDGEPPGSSHGVDVDQHGHGVLDDGRLYQLFRAHDAVRERTLEVAFDEPGAESYAFTFG